VNFIYIYTLHVRNTRGIYCRRSCSNNFTNACFRYFRTLSLESYRVPYAQSTIPATLIGNWEIAGIRSDDVSQSEDITVIGHLKLPERKVTFVLSYIWRTFGEMSYVTMRTRCDSYKRDRLEQNRSFQIIFK